MLHDFPVLVYSYTVESTVAVGAVVGFFDGAGVDNVGAPVGAGVDDVGAPVGAGVAGTGLVGAPVGDEVGVGDGADVDGLGVGEFDGADVGVDDCLLGTCHTATPFF